MEQREYKTPSYQRKVYLAYLERNKNNEDFLNRRREKQREYYRKNKEKILARIASKNASQK